MAKGDTGGPPSENVVPSGTQANVISSDSPPAKSEKAKEGEDKDGKPSPPPNPKSEDDYGVATDFWVPRMPQHRSYIIGDSTVVPGSFTITSGNYSAPDENQDSILAILHIKSNNNHKDDANKNGHNPEESQSPVQQPDSERIKYELKIGETPFDQPIVQQTSATFLVSETIIKSAGTGNSLPTQKQTEYFAEKILFCQKLDALRYNFKISLEHQNARKNLEEVFLKLLQDQTLTIDKDNLKRWAEAVGLPPQQSEQLFSSVQNDSGQITIKDATPEFKLLIFRWLCSIRRTVDGSGLDAGEARDTSRSTETRRRLSAFLTRLDLLRHLSQWHLRDTLNPHQESLEQIGAGLILLALVIPMLNAAIHLSSDVTPIMMINLIHGLMDWPHAYINGPIYLVLTGILMLLSSHYSNQREVDRIGLRYYRLKENLLQQTRTELSNLNLEIQALPPSEYGWTPQGAEKLTEMLGIKEQVKSIDAVFKHWLLDKEGIVSEYEEKKQATASKVRNLLLGGGAAYVTIEVGQYIQDYRDVLQKQDMKSYLAELKSPSTTDATLQKYVESDVGSYSEVIFVFFLVLISVVIKTFFFPAKNSAN